VPSDPTRRALLAASAAALPVLTVGCRGVQALGTAPRPAAGAVRLRAAITAEELMVARYRAAIALLAEGAATTGEGTTGGGPAARAVLAGLAGLARQHSEHLRLLRSRLSPGSPRAALSGPVAAAPSGAVPASPRLAIAGLAVAEQEASDRLLAEVTAVPPSLAQLLASISASEATHVPVLHAAAGTLA